MCHSTQGGEGMRETKKSFQEEFGELPARKKFVKRIFGQDAYDEKDEK